MHNIITQHESQYFDLGTALFFFHRTINTWLDATVNDELFLKILSDLFSPLHFGAFLHIIF